MRLRRKPAAPLTIPEIGESQRRLQLVTAVCLGVVSAVMVAAIVIGSAAFVGLRNQSHKVEVVQAQKIKRLEAQVAVDNKFEKHAIDVIVDLATQVQKLGGNPGRIVLEKPIVREDGTIEPTTTTTSRPLAAPSTATATATTATRAASSSTAATTTTSRPCLSVHTPVTARVCVTFRREDQ